MECFAGLASCWHGFYGLSESAKPRAGSFVSVSTAETDGQGAPDESDADYLSACSDGSESVEAYAARVAPPAARQAPADKACGDGCFATSDCLDQALGCLEGCAEISAEVCAGAWRGARARADCWAWLPAGPTDRDVQALLLFCGIVRGAASSPLAFVCGSRILGCSRGVPASPESGAASAWRQPAAVPPQRTPGSEVACQGGSARLGGVARGEVSASQRRRPGSRTTW